MTIAIISHPDCVLHHAGEAHAEAPQRVEVIQQAIEDYHFKQSLKYYEATPVTRSQLERVHPSHYIDWLASRSPKNESVSLDEDTFMNAHTLRAAYLAAGSVIMAVDLVMAGHAQAAFCNVRPPGHHAESAKAMGFCFFNNVAIGVQHAMGKHNIKRAAIIDFDVHHGNGTQEIFQHNEQVMLCSSFEHPLYPGYEPMQDNKHIINVPLTAGMQGDMFREKVTAAWFDALDAFRPEVIFFSAGFDAHASDPLANIELNDTDYAWVTSQVRAIAERHCQGKIISVLEGGYNLEALAQCVPAHINALV